MIVCDENVHYILAFPKKEAASIALGTVRKWLEINAEKVWHFGLLCQCSNLHYWSYLPPFQVDRIIFCTYSQKNWDVYNSLLPRYFPHQLAAVQDTNGKVSDYVYHDSNVSVHH